MNTSSLANGQIYRKLYNIILKNYLNTYLKMIELNLAKSKYSRLIDA